MKSKVMFVTYGGGHANIAKLIYQYIEAHREYDLRMLALTASVHILKQAGIPYKEINEYLYLFPNKAEIQRIGARLAQKNYDINSGITRESIEAYLGLSLYDLAIQAGSYEKAMAIYMEQGRAAFCPKPTMLRILKMERPDVLVVTSAMRMERAAALAANELGIPVVKVDDLPEVLPTDYSCTICVMNEWARRIQMAQSDMRKTNIVVTGQPVFEQNARIDPQIRKELAVQLRIDNYRKKVLLLTQKGSEELYMQAATKLVQMAREHRDYLFIIKPHPNEEQDAYDSFACNNVNIIKDCKLNCLIDLCDIALTYASTAGLEAALLGKPLITICFEPIDRFDFARYGVAIKVQNPDAMQEAILELCEYPEGAAQQRLKEGRKQFSNKPHATQNIVQLIDRLLVEKTAVK